MSMFFAETLKPCLWFCYKTLQFSVLRQLASVDPGFHHYTWNVLLRVLLGRHPQERVPGAALTTHFWGNPHELYPIKLLSLNVWCKLRGPSAGNSLNWLTEISFNVNFYQIFLNVSAFVSSLRNICQVCEYIALCCFVKALLLTLYVQVFDLFDFILLYDVVGSGISLFPCGYRSDLHFLK